MGGGFEIQPLEQLSSPDNYEFEDWNGSDA